MIPWTVAHQAPLSTELSRQEYWSVLPFSPPEDLSDPGIRPRAPALQVGSLPSELPGKSALSISVLYLVCGGGYMPMCFSNSEVHTQK